MSKNLTKHRIPESEMKLIPPKDENWFVSIGGAGEIGTNLNLYGHDGKWILIDFGISFGNDMTPGVDVVMPDISFIMAHLDRVEALVVTHAHEDHCGAIPYLWKKLQCPIYCTPFTAEIIKAKMADAKVKLGDKLKVIPVNSTIDLDPFKVEMINITHSIPEPSSVYIETKAGNIVHSGDWRLEDDPTIGEKTNVKRFKEIGDKGLDVLVCDSTNATVKHTEGSEREVEENLGRIFEEHQGRILVTCFASNVGRVVSIAKAAKDHGRRVALVGRSLWRMTAAAKQTGYIDHIDEFITENDVNNYEDRELVLICTGSQGESRAAMAKIARGEHIHVKLHETDVVLFSSREIPGNELALNRVKNNLSESHIPMITADDELIHVSGHPAQDELATMYQWLRPHTAVPVHGEIQHQRAHATLARSCQTHNVVIPENGDLYAFSKGKSELIQKVTTGKYALQGDKIVKLDDRTINDRFRMMYRGVVMVSIVMDEAGDIIADPVMSAMGIFDQDNFNIHELDGVIYDNIENMDPKKRADDQLVKDYLEPKIRKYFLNQYGVKPNLNLHIARV